MESQCLLIGACVNFTSFVFMLVSFMFNNVFGKILKLRERNLKVTKKIYRKMGPSCHILRGKNLNSARV